jgi:REP element-mobilizing transposase RayT
MPGSTDRQFHRPHRLDAGAYGDRTLAFHLTLRAYPETRPFRSQLGTQVWRTLLEQDRLGNVQLHAACLMPDHLHLLATPQSVALDRWVGSFKSLTTRTGWSHGVHGRLWQPSFYDRLMRGPGEFEQVLEYIRMNPTTEGLVDNPAEWPWLHVAAQ